MARTIRYRVTGHKRSVADGIGERLVKMRIAEYADLDEAEISPRTGRPKRKYTRKDMQAED
jgi:hypothetical protein